ncbi:MAG: phosphatase PAP2 family protein [Verrucomicrobiota bacterium]
MHDKVGSSTRPWMLPWTLFIDHLSEWRTRARAISIFATLVIILVLLLLPFDHRLVALSSPVDRSGWANEIARGFSYWGDFLTFCVPAALVLFILGLFRNQIFIQRAGVACLLGACLAGLCADILQISIARPRPRNADVAYTLGPSMDSERHAFPSGHSATAFGSATALAVCYPPAAIPLLTGAGGVAWSRLYLGAHYPSDLVGGSALGLLFGFLLGCAAYRKQP